MRFVLLKKSKLKIKNVIPKDKDMPKVSGRRLLRKDPDFDVLLFDINIDGFYPARFRLWPQSHPTNSPTPDLAVAVTSYDSGYNDLQWNLLRETKMIQIIACRCTKQNFCEAVVDFYTEQRFYPQVKEVFVASCPRYPMFKDRFRNVPVDTTCKCLLQ